MFTHAVFGPLIRRNDQSSTCCIVFNFTKWSHVHFESWVNFQNKSFQNAHAISIHRPVWNQGPHVLDTMFLPSKLSVFNIHVSKSELFVCKYISYFWSFMETQPLWQIDMYQQNVFRRGRNEAENHIPNQNSFSFVSMRIKTNLIIFVSRTDFDARCKPGVFQFFNEIWFLFCYRKFSIV